MVILAFSTDQINHQLFISPNHVPVEFVHIPHFFVFAFVVVNFWEINNNINNNHGK
jgi:hypothetical protein